MLQNQHGECRTTGVGQTHSYRRVQLESNRRCLMNSGSLKSSMLHGKHGVRYASTDFKHTHLPIYQSVFLSLYLPFPLCHSNHRWNARPELTSNTPIYLFINLSSYLCIYLSHSTTPIIDVARHHETLSQN